MKTLQLIRYKNLLMFALMQLLFNYGFLRLQNISLALKDWQYALLVLSTVCIAAGGYIINNIFDVDTDLENKPNDVIVGKYISETKAYNLYFGFTSFGVVLGFYLSNVINKPGFAAIFILLSATLYFYAASLKQSFFLGNLVAAFMTSFSVVIIGIFQLFPILNPENQPQLRLIFSIILDYAIFCFLINLIREIVKDLEDIKGDSSQGMKTVPIVLGIKKTTKLVVLISLIPVICVSNYIYKHLFLTDLLIATLFGLVFILSPLLYFQIKIFYAKSQNKFHHLSTVLKWILLFGILSILVINLNIKYNAFN